MDKSDTYFLQIALEEAKKASWPFGAVVVKDGVIIAQAGSGDGMDVDFDPTAHAEINAIRRACNKLKSGDLTGAILYTTCEPCTLCFGGAWYSYIKNIVYGTSLEDIKEINKFWGGDLGFPHDHIVETGINIHGGILKDEIMEMYKTHPKVVKFNK